jgi:hypothetical protein
VFLLIKVLSLKRVTLVTSRKVSGAPWGRVARGAPAVLGTRMKSQRLSTEARPGGTPPTLFSGKMVGEPSGVQKGPVPLGAMARSVTVGGAAGVGVGAGVVGVGAAGVVAAGGGVGVSAAERGARESERVRAARISAASVVRDRGRRVEVGERMERMRDSRVEGRAMETAEVRMRGLLWKQVAMSNRVWA